MHITCGKTNTDHEDELLCYLCSTAENALEQRKRSISHLETQAKKMKCESDKKFPAVPAGTTVRLPIPDLDKGRGDLRNVLAVIMSVTEDGFYRLGTADGILKQLLYARSQSTVCPKKLMYSEDVPQKTTTLRTTAIAQSLVVARDLSDVRARPGV
uniref:Ribosomal RNA small subunit methyltransferase H n=1 Tax=Lygus hesperus TaxID=30085 RepID=A0A0A9W4T5_LYGHE